MISLQHHIIGRIVLEVDTNRSTDAWELQEDLSQLIQQRAISRMEQLFSQWVYEDEIVRLDELEIVLPPIDREHLADEFVPKLIEALRQALDDRIPKRRTFNLPSGIFSSITSELSLSEPSADVISQTLPASEWKGFLYFLEYGRLSWQQQHVSFSTWIDRWENILQSDVDWRSPLKQCLIHVPAARTRLVSQLPVSFLQSLLQRIQPAWHPWIFLLAEAKALMQLLAASATSSANTVSPALRLHDGTIQYLEQQAWLLVFAEIRGDTAVGDAFPYERWLQPWLTELITAIARENPSMRLTGGDSDSQGTSYTYDESRKEFREQLATHLSIEEQLQSSIAKIRSADKQRWLAAIATIMPTMVSVQRDRNQTNQARTAQNRIDGNSQVNPLAKVVVAQENLSSSEPFTISSLTADRTDPSLESPRLSTEVDYQIDNELVEAHNRSPELTSLMLTNVFESSPNPANISNSSNSAMPTDAAGISRVNVDAPLPSEILSSSLQTMDASNLAIPPIETQQLVATEDSLVEPIADAEAVISPPYPFTNSPTLTELTSLRNANDAGISSPVEPPSLKQSAQADVLSSETTSTQLSQEDVLSENSILQEAASQVESLSETVPSIFSTEITSLGDAIPSPRPMAAEDDSYQTPLTEQLPTNESTIFPDRLSLFPPQTSSSDISSEIETQVNTSQAESLLTAPDRLASTQIPLVTTESFVDGLTSKSELPTDSSSRSFGGNSAIPPEEIALNEAQWRSLSESLNEASSLPSEVVPQNSLAENTLTESLAALSETSDPIVTSQISDKSSAMGQFGRTDRPASESDFAEPDLRSATNRLVREESSAMDLSAIPAEASVDGDATDLAEDRDEPTLEPRIETSREAVIEQESASLAPQTAARWTHPLMANPPKQAIGSNLSQDERVNGIYLNNAGLVLLHPFLKFYFEAVGLLYEDSFRNEYTQQQAIALLHYLATGEPEAPEYALVLPKLLCGWPLHDPVVGNLELPETALAEGEQMLQVVINYWDVLKNTSPDGLREGFLKRQGKLTRSESGVWKLRVEQQAIDILLSRLPWGLSMVKLPWMQEVMVVEWT